MESNYIVDLIDEEIDKLREVQRILQSLLPGEAMIAPVLEAHDPEEAQAEAAHVAEQTPQPAVRHVSRRGIATGRRGPRKVAQTTPPRPLDAPVPQAPVVVARPVVIAKPAPTPQSQPAEGTLEEWVRSLRPAATL